MMRATRTSAASSVRRGFSSSSPMHFRKLLAANRGEIATRILRASNELQIPSCAIYSKEDRFTQHRFKADQAFLTGSGLSPVGAYLDIPGITKICVENGVEAVHPGYGFLSETAEFAESLNANGITFVGPTVQNLATFGDKTAARALAIKTGVPVVPGTPNAVTTGEEARHWIEDSIDGAEPVGYPVIIKASMGGGGRGMRVVERSEDLAKNIDIASSEALAAFGCGDVFLERYVKDPRHIEVQILGDGAGKCVHLYDRDCSVQRRYQKVVETAPATGLPEATRQALFDDAVRLCETANYKNAGTVEFLVDTLGRHYFIEVNPRIQVEHTVTEEVTGIDLVQSQIRIAAGESLTDLGLSQDTIFPVGHAMQCRVTTEDPSDDFRPDTGSIDVFRTPGGFGIRIDDGPGFVGANITPHYDSLLVKITSRAAKRKDAAIKLRRALEEFRVRGVHTNKPFLLGVLNDEDFLNRHVTTSFIAEKPHLLAPATTSNRGQRILQYMGEVLVNGTDPSLGADPTKPPSSVDPKLPDVHVFEAAEAAAVAAEPAGKRSLRQTYLAEGATAFANAVRANDGLLVTDTTWRDAHQSLLATRVRTHDILKIAPATKVALRNAYSLECWGGATFDVSMRFLNECPWDRLGLMREAVPDIPFQMLLRGANAVGYTSYPDNAVYKFCETAQKHGMDVFRVFDSLNYAENMKLGIDAVGQAGGIVEAAICYTGDITDPKRGRYNLDYYLDFARTLVGLGAHVICIKDMAGLLKPEAASMLVGALREAYPHIPVHVHTHDTAMTGVASMLAAAAAGADAVDVATDALSGTTSQPSLGAVANAVRGTKHDTGLDLDLLNDVNDYWEEARGLYAPFESGQKSGSSDVHRHEMPGGQYTNLLFQSTQLGLTGQWSSVKKAYGEANKVLGDIIKVTPSSKVTGDLAQFMVANNLNGEQVVEQAETLSFPTSVVEYMQGYLGLPPFGFPEPFRTRVLKGKTLPEDPTKTHFDGRPGAELQPIDFEGTYTYLTEQHSARLIKDVDVMSHVMYPAVFKDFMANREKFGDLSKLDTRTFLTGLQPGQEVAVEIEAGKTLIVRLVQRGETDADGFVDVLFELNGANRVIRVKDKSAAVDTTARAKADPNNPQEVGASMPGVVVEAKVSIGDSVEAGDPLVVLSAMKMESVIASPVSGVVRHLPVASGDSLAAGDLIATVE